MYVFGEEINAEYQRLEIVLVPCNYLHTHLGYTEDFISDECIADLQAQKDYLGPLDVVLYYNDEDFDQQEFGDKSILRQSRIMRTQISQEFPVWTNYKV